MRGCIFGRTSQHARNCSAIFEKSQTHERDEALVCRADKRRNPRSLCLSGCNEHYKGSSWIHKRGGSRKILLSPFRSGAIVSAICFRGASNSHVIRNLECVASSPAAGIPMEKSSSDEAGEMDDRVRPVVCRRFLVSDHCRSLRSSANPPPLEALLMSPDV